MKSFISCSKEKKTLLLKDEDLKETKNERYKVWHIVQGRTTNCQCRTVNKDMVKGEGSMKAVDRKDINDEN